MSQIFVRDFLVQDAIEILNDCYETNTETATFSNWLKSIQDNKEFGKAFTILNGAGVIIACGGVRTVWDGVGEGWVMYSRKMNGEFRQVYMYTKRTMHSLIEDLNLHRLQATARLDNDRACRLLEKLGFQIEGMMKRYTADKRDCLMYVHNEGIL